MIIPIPRIRVTKAHVGTPLLMLLVTSSISPLTAPCPASCCCPVLVTNVLLEPWTVCGVSTEASCEPVQPHEVTMARVSIKEAMNLSIDSLKGLYVVLMGLLVPLFDLFMMLEV